MGYYKKVSVKDGRPARVSTSENLDVRVYNDQVDIDMDRPGLGVEVRIVGRDDVGAPPGAVYVVSFYRPDECTGANGQRNDAKSSLPGVVYIGPDGVVISGSSEEGRRIHRAEIVFER